MAFSLTELLWQQKVGIHARAAELKRVKDEAKQAAAYEQSRQRLLKQQGGVILPAPEE